jgi:hypothetical protein
MFRIIVAVTGDDAVLDDAALYSLVDRIREAGTAHIVSPAGSVEVDIRIINS